MISDFMTLMSDFTVATSDFKTDTSDVRRSKLASVASLNPTKKSHTSASVGTYSPVTLLRSRDLRGRSRLTLWSFATNARMNSRELPWGDFPIAPYMGDLTVARYIRTWALRRIRMRSRRSRLHTAAEII